MQKIYINTTTRQWFDTDGALFGSGSPQLAYKRTEEIALQLCSETPDAGTDGVNPETDWTKDSSFGVGGIGAKLSIDNDFLRRRKGTLSAAIPAGSVSTVTAAIEGASKATIRTGGILKVFDADGNAEALEYESAAFSGNSVTFTLKSGSEVENSYAQGAEMDVPDALYAQAMMDSEKSDAATGLFVFNIVVYSEKLRAVMEYANIANLDTLAGMELLLFKTSGDTITELNNFLCTTVSLHATMAEANTLAQVPPSMTDELVSLITSTLGDVQYEYSEDGTTWHSTRTDADNYFRFKLTGSGSSGTWITANMINGTTPHIGENGNWYIGETDTGVSAEGEDGDTPYIDPETLHWIIGDTETGISAQGIIVQIQYSADAQNWHDAFASGDKFIRFSPDRGVSWSAAMKFIGDNAPQVMIQYSADGSSWHQVLSADDYFIRFSVDNGTTWGGGSQFRAYAVRYQYGETASAVFHDNFVAGSDKFVKFSSDNGSTWTNAFKFIGDDGRSFVPDATGTYADISDYDAENQGFSYLVTSGTNEGKIYFKTSDTSGEWSDGLQFTPNGLSLQYSLDGSSWHTTATVDDKYIRFSTDDGTTWSAACLFKGHSTYTYTAYASDNSGNDFSLTPSSDLDFWNWIYSENPIAAENLTLQTFNTLGDGWRRCQGDPGITYDWLSGASVPNSSTGKNGDWYLDTSTGNVYQKVSGSWSLKMNIIGPVGAGVTTRGGWLALTSYDKNDMVTYQGNAYIADRDNSNVEPGTSSDDWILYISKGDTGPAPTIGANGNWYINGVDTGLPSRGPNGITPSIGSNGNWWLGSTDTGVKAEISGSYIEFSAVDSSGNYTLAGTTTVPYAVLTNAGHFYPVEKGSVTVDTVNNTTTLNVAPYLAYDGAASFSGTWRLYFAAGEVKAGDEIVTLTGTVITPQHGAVFRKTLAASEAFTINTASLTASKQVTFELHLIQPSTAVSFTLPNTLLWPDLDHFASGNQPPAMGEADTLYCIVIRWDGADLLANLAYSKEVSA